MPDIYKDMSPRVVDKSASYTIVPADIGTIFVATGAATFTLPQIADVWNGWNVEIVNGADSAVTVTAPTGKLVTFNNTAATSIAWSTTSEKIGAAVRIVYDAALSKFLALLMTEETQTTTVS